MAISFLLSFLLLIIHPAREDPTPQPAREWIVFDSDRDGNREIYLCGPEGEDIRRLTADPAADESPRLSPDKTRVIFESDRDGNGEIYLINIDGSGLTRLTDHPARDWSPAWSPDGRRILFCSDRDGSENFYTMDPAGSDLKQLTRYRDEGARFGAVYSPGGDRLAFTLKSKPGRRWRAAVMDLADLSVREFCGGPGNCHPGWSPDGETVTLVRHIDRPNTEIYLHSLSSRELTRLTDNPAKDYFPVFSPDGKKILFSSLRDTGRWQLFLYDLERGTVRPFMTSPGNDRLPHWR